MRSNFLVELIHRNGDVTDANEYFGRVDTEVSRMRWNILVKLIRRSEVVEDAIK